MMLACLLAAVVEVSSFGAKGDGATLDTVAIQRAIDQVAAEGGGEVVLKYGVYLTGTLYLKSHVTLRLERAACLRGSPDLKDYNAEDAYPQNWGSPSPENWRAHHLLLALEQEDVAVVGEGIVDGNGRAFFSERVHAVGTGTWRFGAMNAKDCANAVRAGQMLVFVECRGVRVEGVRLYDAPCWNCFCHGCEDVLIRNDYGIEDIGKSQSAYCGILAESNRVSGISFADGIRIVRDCETRDNGQSEVEVKYEERPAKYYDATDPFYRPKVLLERTRIGPGAACALDIREGSCVTLQRCTVRGERKISPSAEVVEFEPVSP